MDSSTEEAQEATWEKVSDYFKEITERIERQQQERLERLKQALEEVE